MCDKLRYGFHTSDEVLIVASALTRSCGTWPSSEFIWGSPRLGWWCSDGLCSQSPLASHHIVSITFPSENATHTPVATLSSGTQSPDPVMADGAFYGDCFLPSCIWFSSCLGSSWVLRSGCPIVWCWLCWDLWGPHRTVYKVVVLRLTPPKNTRPAPPTNSGQGDLLVSFV